MLIRRFLLNRDVLFEFHQREVYYKVDRLLTGLTAQPKGTTARWYSNKTSLVVFVLDNALKGKSKIVKPKFYVINKGF